MSNGQKRVWIWAGLFLVCLVSSLLSFALMRGLENDKLKAKYVVAGKDRVVELQKELDRSFLVLNAFQAFYSAADQMDRKAFEAFVAPLLSRNIAVDTVAWLPRVPDRRRDFYEKAARREGLDEFRITEENGQGVVVPARRRPEYFPVFYKAPFFGDHMPIGADMAALPEIGSAIEFGRDRGRALAVTLARLSADIKNRYDLYVLAPVYDKGAGLHTTQSRRRHFKGVFVGAFNTGHLVERAFGHWSPAVFDILILDVSAPQNRRLLYFRSPAGPHEISRNTTAANPGRKRFFYQQQINMGGRNWLVQCIPTPENIAAQRSSGPWIVLILVLLTTASLSALLLLSFNRRKALALAKDRLEIEARDRKEKQRALKSANELLEKFFATDDLQIAYMDAAFNYIRVNGAYAMANNRTPAFFHGKNHFALYPDTETEAIFRQAVDTGRPYRAYARPAAEPARPQSDLTYWNMTVRPVEDDGGHVTAVIYYLLDVTEHVRMASALQVSESRFKTLIETNADAILVLNEQGVIRYANPAAALLFDKPRDALVDSEFGYPVATAAAPAEIEILRPGGENLIAEMHVLSIDWENAPAFFLTLRNITQRRQAEAQQAMLYAAIDQALDCIIITDRDRRIQYVNPAFESVTRYSAEAVIGRTLAVIEPGDREQKSYAHILSDLKRGSQWRGRLVNRRKDDSVFEADVNISPIGDEMGQITHYVIIEHDITQEVQLETRLRQTQKMEAIGTLAGGIAHDFNNLLSAIIGFAELSRKRTTDSAIAPNLDMIYNAGLRAGDLVKQILAFSRYNERELKPLELHLIIKEALKLLGVSLPKNIEIRKSLQAEDRVLADPGQMQQVVLNLCTNAYHAMADNGGVLAITLSNREFDSREVESYPDLNPGRYTVLSVSDTGCGMDAKTMERIFDPYFTTKEKDRGTGLGLAAVHGIVKSHSGTITVYSEPGQGSTFNVYLPSIEAPAPGRVETAASGPLTGSENILFVDDEDAVKDMVRQMLAHLGYRAIAESDSRQALKRFRQDPAAFDLVITDMNMPGLNGLQLADAIAAVRPGMPIILCTGFSELVNENNIREAGIIGAVIMKPIQLKAFSRVIRKVLDNGKQSGENDHDETDRQ